MKNKITELKITRVQPNMILSMWQIHILENVWPIIDELLHDVRGILGMKDEYK